LKAQQQLQANATLFSGKPTKDVRLLKGKLRCPCGSRMHGEQSHGKPFYRCGSGKQGKHCGAPYYAAGALEEAVRAQIEGLLRNPATLRVAIEANAATNERDTTDREASQERADVAKANKHPAGVYGKAIDGTSH